MPSPLYQNIPGASGYLCGKYLNEYNQYLEQPIASSYFGYSTWTATPDTYFLIEHPELYDHIHFLETPSSGTPPASSFYTAPYGYGDFIAVPMSDGVRYTHLVQHNCLHQQHGGSHDVRTLGPYWIDNTAPYGSMSIASGMLKISAPTTFVKAVAFDAYSGVSGLYLDGDLEDGPNVRQWIPFVGIIDVQLISVYGRRTVNIRFMDYAGNESGLYVDDIFLGDRKYFFLPTNVKYAHLDPDNNAFTSQDLYMKTNFPSFKEAIENGELRST